MRLNGNMLKKKMFRDIKNNVSQFITIFLMVTIGIMAYCGINAYIIGMTKTADIFYKENNLQDLNLIRSNFTNDDLDIIKNIDNITGVIYKHIFSKNAFIKHKAYFFLFNTLNGYIIKNTSI